MIHNCFKCNRTFDDGAKNMSRDEIFDTVFRRELVACNKCSEEISKKANELMEKIKSGEIDIVERIQEATERLKRKLEEL